MRQVPRIILIIICSRLHHPPYPLIPMITSRPPVHAKFPKPEDVIRVGVWKPFLDITPQDAHDCLQINAAAALSFAPGAILAFIDNNIEKPSGKRRALIFTGATSSARDNVVTSAFAAGRFGTRALSQSLAKGFGMENIQVVYVRLYQVLSPRFLTRLALQLLLVHHRRRFA
jgi:NAD(P)-dependent dehydrogenase (short-subunit alcohol dehydrogenase family)